MDVLKKCKTLFGIFIFNEGTNLNLFDILFNKRNFPIEMTQNSLDQVTSFRKMIFSKFWQLNPFLKFHKTLTIKLKCKNYKIYLLVRWTSSSKKWSRILILGTDKIPLAWSHNFLLFFFFLFLKFSCLFVLQNNLLSRVKWDV